MSDKQKKDFYYSNQEPVFLETDDDFLAFDMDDIKKPSPQFKKFVKEHAESMRKSVYLVAVADLTDKMRKVITDNSAQRPVFRSGENMVIVLPEVRVDDADEKLESKLAEWVENHNELAHATKDRRGRTIIEPKDKSGKGALEIARSLVEDLKVESAQPRTLQKIRSPHPAKK